MVNNNPRKNLLSKSTEYTRDPEVCEEYRITIQTDMANHNPILPVFEGILRVKAY